MLDAQIQPLAQELYDLKLDAAAPLFDLLPPGDHRLVALYHLIGWLSEQRLVSQDETARVSWQVVRKFRQRVRRIFWPELCGRDPLEHLRRWGKALRTTEEFFERLRAESNEAVLMARVPSNRNYAAAMGELGRLRPPPADDPSYEEIRDIAQGEEDL